MSGRDRQGGFASNPSPQKERRPTGDVRGGGNPMPGASGMSRAEKFEDEKQRIIQSCFSKQESDGSTIESYITHIRVTEDGNYPSIPPPPNSPPENKKPRVIIVAVRKSGRVRVHKARENSDGSFSIGKTWMLDDLARIQTYENLVPSTPIEQQQKQWASNVGFVVTITKPYYWQSDTPKERDFFIGSLVKIYKKYTGGKLPVLVGFDSRDREILTGTGSGGSQPVKAPKIPEPSPARTDPRLPRSRSPSVQPNLAQSPASNRAPSRDGPKESRRQPSREQFMRNQPSQEQMQRMRPPFSPRQQLQTPPSREGLSAKVAESPVPSEYPVDSTSRKRAGAVAADGRPNQISDSTMKTTTLNENGSIPRSPLANKDQSPARDRLQLKLDFEDVSPFEPLKQRFSPQDKPNDVPLGALRLSPRGSKGSMGQKSLRADLEDNSVTPRSIPEPSKTELKPPSRGSDKSYKALEPEPYQRTAGIAPLSRSNGSDATMPEPVNNESDASRKRESAEPAPLQISIKKTPASPSAEEETHRPGLGPMVKKKPGKDLANAFRKAATAYSAFKPRAGGAAERLMAAKEKADNEPDGITSVIPAPFLRVQSSETGKGTSTKETTGSQGSPKLGAKDASAAKSKAIETSSRKKRPVSPMPPPEPREDNSAQYCNALGINHSLLNGRGVDFDHILTDLGWDGKLQDDKNAEDLEADIRREIGRVQASSWLGHLESQEGQANELAQLFDRAIEECEELDGLLTLYSHELSTLADDVIYIEAQAEGLQVKVSNQKLLQTELQNLLKSPEGVK
ncbi:GTP-Rho binding exocyst subunit [Emydomyces testavorans]|uniref:GTP-Rho binding exocyst subunit n=1 Tax=Emydomyces testavorans TaxID=2070801 RepID=A0AAF0IJ49_9EURO|nr:GTP-Rho binding exocyst subunit [Emydomyces testavorans]